MSTVVRPLGDYEEACTAYEAFIRANTTVESSVLIDRAIDDMKKATSHQEAFATLLRHHLFNMDMALKWVLFISTVTPEMKEFSTHAKFSADEAIALIIKVYDLGVKAVVWDLFQDDSDDEEDDDDDDD